MKSISEAKKEAALRAVRLVQDGQNIGLGTGSTANFAIIELSKRVKAEGLNLRFVASSYETSHLATKLGLDCLSLEYFSQLDISIDGADEIDPELNLIKGGGGAHTQEKIMHSMTKRFIVIADSSKQVKTLGKAFPVPIEIVPCAKSFVAKNLDKLGVKEYKLRVSTNKCGPTITDNGNWIIDAYFEIDNPLKLELELNKISGVLENGIFARIRPNAKDCLVV